MNMDFHLATRLRLVLLAYFSTSESLFFFWLIGLSQTKELELLGQTVISQPFCSPTCYNAINLQLGNCLILAVRLRATTNNKQRTNQIHAACYTVLGLNKAAAKFFLLRCLIWDWLMVPRLA